MKTPAKVMEVTWVWPTRRKIALSQDDYVDNFLEACIKSP